VTTHFCIGGPSDVQRKSHWSCWSTSVGFRRSAPERADWIFGRPRLLAPAPGTSTRTQCRPRLSPAIDRVRQVPRASGQMAEGLSDREHAQAGACPGQTAGGCSVPGAGGLRTGRATSAMAQGEALAAATRAAPAASQSARPILASRPPRRRTSLRGWASPRSARARCRR
jgi:hypothetical protein